MTDSSANLRSIHPSSGEISLLSLGCVLLRWRRIVVGFGVFGAVAGFAAGITRGRVFTATAAFIPQGTEVGGVGDLAAAASQFGIRLPSSGTDLWGPAVYAELLTSNALLEPIALDTVVVRERGGRRAALADLLRVKASTPERRTELTVRALRRILTVTDDRQLSAVRLSVTTPWPSVSLAVALELLRGVNEFNLETRKSQAAAERQFVEAQAAGADSALRAAEDRLQSFLQRNRALANSPELTFQDDRLRRAVALRQQIYTSLMQSLEGARIREVRDTPVITVLEPPHLPVIAAPRGLLRRTTLGGLGAGIVGVMIAFLAQGLVGARRAASAETQMFFELLEQSTPRILRRKRKS